MECAAESAFLTLYDMLKIQSNLNLEQLALNKTPTTAADQRLTPRFFPVLGLFLTNRRFMVARPGTMVSTIV
jgi:hypothetical protein